MLGVSPIRDAFSDLFFPGISAIQTLAKYFSLFLMRLGTWNSIINMIIRN